MNNYDDLFTANGEKKESKTERPFNKEEWAAKKQQERAEAFEMLDNATLEAVANPETFRDYRKGTGLLDVYMHSLRMVVADNASEEMQMIAEHFSHPYPFGIPRPSEVLKRISFYPRTLGSMSSALK